MAEMISLAGCQRLPSGVQQALLRSSLLMQHGNPYGIQALYLALWQID